jgi:Ni/Fe-hydrogenase 1 B-type cytochrome subunit
MQANQIYRVESECVTRYYVWDPVVRISHWINIIVVGVLIFTGLYISTPFYRPNVDEPFGASIMATMKNLHFLSAIIFTLNGLFRAYWWFAGNTYRQWFRFHIWRADFWKEAWWKLKDYITLRYTDYELHTLGHNTLATLTYVILFLAASVQGLTGFAMAGRINPGGFFDTLFGWVIPLFGGEANVRMIHKMIMWGIIGFMIHHISFVIYLEVFREKGMLSSMITGLKTRPLGWEPIEKPWEKGKK